LGRNLLYSTLREFNFDESPPKLIFASAEEVADKSFLQVRLKDHNSALNKKLKLTDPRYFGSSVLLFDIDIDQCKINPCLNNGMVNVSTTLWEAILVYARKAGKGNTVKKVSKIACIESFLYELESYRTITAPRLAVLKEFDWILGCI